MDTPPNDEKFKCQALPPDEVSGFGQSALPHLIAALGGAHSEAAILMLVEVVPPPLDAVVRVLQRPSKRAAAALGVLWRWEPRAAPAVPAIRAAFQGKRISALEYLGALREIGPGAEAALPDVSDLAASSDLPVREQAVEALGALRSREALGPLTVALQHPDARTRFKAAAALRAMGAMASPAIPALQTALSDPDVSVRAAAAEALRRIQPQSAVRLRAVH